MQKAKWTNKLSWAINRWKAMDHPGEGFYRIRQAWQMQVMDRLERRKPPGQSAGLPAFLPQTPAFYQPQTASPFFQGLDIRPFPLYDTVVPDITAVGDWRRDLAHGVTSAQGFVNSIPAQSFEKIGDFRYVCVPSRFHHFPFMAMLATAGQPQWAQTLTQQLRQWETQNPYLNSIHWKSGIEAGIRSVNLVYTRRWASQAPELFAECLPILDRVLITHFHFLTRHLSLYSSANNHLLAELLGIFAITAHYDGKAMTQWREKAFSWLEEELFAQTHADGFTKEQSAHYHAEVLQMYMIWAALAQKTGMTPSQEALQRIAAMVEFVRLLTRPDGHLLDIGDSDEGQLFFPYFDPSFSLYQSLQTDWALISQSGKEEGLRFDLRNYLVWGEKGKAMFSNLPITKKRSPMTNYFESSGYCVIEEDGCRIWFDVGDLGYGSLAAHGHSDLLHFSLEVNGIPFIVDVGTYQYHARFAKWRNYFRGISAHNTLSINNLQHAADGGRMIWLNHPQIVERAFTESDTEVMCRAAHNGFDNQGAGVIHGRILKYAKKQSSFSVTDELWTSESGSLAFHLHFHPEILPQLQGTTLTLRHQSGASVVLENPNFAEASLIKGDENRPLGWFAPQFNRREPTYTLYLSLPFSGDFLMKTDISFTY